jgi:alkaline phosphatase D
MARMDRRRFLQTASAIGAAAAWASAAGSAAEGLWKERRDLFPEGVASGDPEAGSVLLWTRRPHGAHDTSKSLRVEVAEDAAFARVVARAEAHVSAESDWTSRVLVGGLKPSTVYWYRFSDAEGNGSRVGRTITAPADQDDRPVQIAFVSCQNANDGAQNAYRRMIYEDEHAPEQERLGFVLHLGDFIYEIVWYPEDRPQGMYDRRLRDIVRYPHGEKIADFHVLRMWTIIALYTVAICMIPICRMRGRDRRL